MTQEHPIRVACRRTGLSAHVLRIWEKRYRAVIPRRSPTKRRFYTDEDIERLTLLKQATAVGRSIGQIAGLSRAELMDLLRQDAVAGASAVFNAQGDEHSVEAFVENCMRAARNLDSKELEASLARASASLSQPAFLENFLVRMMSRTGDCWRDGTMRVMHEHLLSSMLRSYLGVWHSGAPGHGPLLIATTPAGQLHEMGALATAATAASEGWRVLYLGPNLPYEEIAGAAAQQRARVVALSILYPPDDARLGPELIRLRQALGLEVELIAGGRAATAYLPVLQEIRATVLDDLTSFRKHLESVRLRSRP